MSICLLLTSEVVYKHMAVSYREAGRMVEDILSTNDEVMAVSIMEVKGNVLAAKSKESFKEDFKAAQDRSKYGGMLAVEMLRLVNQVRNIAGAPKAIITLHEGCKLMLVPVPSCKILVGVVLRYSSAKTEDYDIANRIERLVAYALDDGTTYI
jgi:hypothetical protein